MFSFASLRRLELNTASFLLNIIDIIIVEERFVEDESEAYCCSGFSVFFDLDGFDVGAVGWSAEWVQSLVGQQR